MPELELKMAASAYHDIGISVVPFNVKEKRPLKEWKQWISQKQTTEEFEALPWKDADGFAIVCGSQLDDGTYIGAIDYDVKNLSEAVVQKGKEILKKLRATYAEETPSKGQHFIFHTHVKPKTVSVFHNDYALELLGEGKLCIVAPSLGYRLLNDNSPSEVQDLTMLFYDLIGEKEKLPVETWFNRDEYKARPYKKDDPHCIMKMLHGVPEGLRNEVAIRLSSYLLNFKQLTTKKAFETLEEWNSHNTPRMPLPELKAVFDSALKGKYVYSCGDPLLHEFCENTEGCSLKAKAPEKKETMIYDAETEEKIAVEVKNIVDAPNELEVLAPHLDKIVVGEDSTKKALAVLLISSKFQNPKLKQIILLKATEGSGKSTLMNTLTTGYKVKDVGRFSAHALDYTDLEGYDILRLKELGSMDEEKQGISTIKFLSSDDQGYTVEVTAKDEATGKFKTEQYKIPPITVISGTTRLIFDPQFERRAWPYGLDETEEQTARIREWKAEKEIQEADKLLGYRKLTDYEFSLEVYKRFIEHLKPVDVIIPFPNTLLEILGTEVLRIRGDMDKLLTFVKLYAQLNQKRIQQARENVYVCSPEVCMEALDIVIKPLTSMLSKIDERTQGVLNALKNVHGLKESEEGKESSQSYSLKGDVIDRDAREQIAVQLGKSESTIRKFFNQLEDSGYVSGDNKKPRTYTLLYNLSDIEEKLSGISSKIKSPDILKGEMAKEAQKWLETRSFTQSAAGGIKKSNIAENHNITNGEATSQILPTAEETVNDPNSSAFQVSTAKQSDNNRAIKKCPIIPDNLLVCPACRAKGKLKTFATEEDLKAHTQTWHGSNPTYVR